MEKSVLYTFLQLWSFYSIQYIGKQIIERKLDNCDNLDRKMKNWVKLCENITE